MTEAWIEDLAQDIKERHREAAQDYGRSEHYAGVVAARGPEYFFALVSSLRQNVDALRGRLQGDPTSADTVLQTIKPDEVKITRARFPWVDARLVHNDDTITLDYAKRLGTAGDPALDRTSCGFVLRVGPDETLFVEEAFAAEPKSYAKPEELARHITEVLFAVGPASSGK
jgi:hypothetical protein